MLSLILAGAAGIGSYLEQQEQEKATKNKAGAISKAFNDMMYTKGEMAFRADQVGDTYDTSMQDTANAAAVNARSVLNPAVIRTMATAKVQGQKLQAITNQRMSDENINRDLGLKSKLAKAEGIVPNMSLSAGFAGALQGFQTGMSLDNSFSMSESMSDLYSTESAKNKGLKWNKDKKTWE